MTRRLPMSALLRITDSTRASRHVSKVPKAESRIWNALSRLLQIHQSFYFDKTTIKGAAEMSFSGAR
jgi:hypothetical protein